MTGPQKTYLKHRNHLRRYDWMSRVGGMKDENIWQAWGWPVIGCVFHVFGELIFHVHDVFQAM